MAKYQVYGIGNALVDLEYEVGTPDTGHSLVLVTSGLAEPAYLHNWLKYQIQGQAD